MVPLNIKILSTLNFFKIITSALVLAVMILQVYYNFHYPIWRDDAGFGELAKNMVNGEGYSATMFDKLYPFSYLIATAGPTIILPAAASIFLFGNTYWAIGLANIFLIWSLMVLIFIAADSVLEKKEKWLFCFFGLFFCFLFSSGDQKLYGIETGDSIALWHLLMGEVPASLCVILGAFLFSSSESKNKIITGGLFLGMAVMAKTITCFAVAIITMVLGFRIVWDKKINIPKKIKLLAITVAAVIAPILLFEIAKILILGWQGYNEFQIENAAFYKQIGLVKNNAYQRLESLSVVFGLGYLYPIIVAFVVACFSTKRPSIANSLGLALLACFALHLLWWINFSINGSYRHLVVGLFCFCAGLSLLLANIDYSKLFDSAITSFFIFFLVIGRMSMVHYNYNFDFEKTARLKEQLEILEAVKELEAQKVTLFSCGSNFELEYLLPGSRHFKDCLDMPKENSSAAMLVSYFVNGSKLVAMRPQYPFAYVGVIPEEILNQCSQKYMESENFSLHWCK